MCDISLQSATLTYDEDAVHEVSAERPEDDSQQDNHHLSPSAVM